jgi:hypothetical protein
VLVGGVWVHGDLLGPLNDAAARLGLLWHRLKAEHRFSQGYSSRAWGGRGVKASGDTHDAGFAVDIITDRWKGHPALTQAEAGELVTALRKSGFEAALRVRGYDLGNGSRVQTEHCHFALRGHSNAGLLALSTGPGGHAELSKMLASRQRYA